MYFNFSSSDNANSSTNLARKKSAKASRNFASAYKFFYMLCKTMVFWALFPQKKRRKPFVYGHSPLRQDKDNTFSAEIQISLTYRNSFRNVKRRVLHTRGFAMCYITRAGALRAISPSCRSLCSLSFNGRFAPQFQRKPAASQFQSGTASPSFNAAFGCWLNSQQSLNNQGLTY